MKKLFSILSLLLCGLALHAQIGAGGYNPENPPGPNEDGDTVQYVVLHLYSDPANGGAFSWGLGAQGEYYYYVEPGKQYTATSYPKTGFDFSHWTQDDETVGREKQYTFTAPNHDFELTCHYIYNPENPANPGKNYWNAVTGDLIITDFKPGHLQNALNEALPSDWKALKTVTVAGTCAQGYEEGGYHDWSAFGGAPNLVAIDMSRTSGLDYVPASQFYNNKVLNTIYLPASTAEIRNGAFQGCSSLQRLICHATTPPKLGTNVFQGAGEFLTVQVPAESMGLYAAAEGWKDMTLAPIVDQVSKLTVSLPELTDMALYRDMTLELTNLQTGQAKRYIITDRTAYTFSNLIHNTAYNAYLRTRSGGIVGRIDSIAIIDHDVQVAFKTLKRPVDVSLRLLETDSEDAYTVTWSDTRGNYLSRDTVLSSQLEGDSVTYSIRLGEALGKQYRQPADSTYRVTREGVIRLHLEPWRQVSISGTVSSEATGMPLRGANIAVTQQLNDQYPVTQTVRSDRDGRWTMTVYDAPASVTSQADGYVKQTLTFGKMEAGQTIVHTLPDISGTVINLDLYYRPSLAEGEEDTSTDTHFDDPTDVSYSVYDVTHQRQMTTVSEQFPLLVLPDDSLDYGTELRITAQSKSRAFMPVESSCRVDSSRHATVSIGITQLGIVEASFEKTDNQRVVAIIYDAEGRLVGCVPYSGTTLTIESLPDGDYTLITMGYSPMMIAVPTLTALREMGIGDSHVATNSLTVQSGRILKIHNTTIPTFDEAEFRYTGSATRLSANKTRGTVGQYVTLRAQVDFKDTYAANVGDVSLTFDLPDGCEMVEGSMMVGSSLVTDYLVKDRQVIVSLPDAAEGVRFCVVPTRSGQMQPAAMVGFRLGDRQVSQPIGSALIDIEDMAIEIRATSATGHMPVGGMALPNSRVEVYDGDALIGQTTALLSGTWSTWIDLVRPYNMSQHPVYAIITTPEGMTMQTATQTVAIDHAEVMPVVDMSFLNNLHGNIIEHVIWDFRTNTVNKSSYGWPLDHDTLDVAYRIDFMSEDQIVNDTTQVKDVVLGVELDDGSLMTMKAYWNRGKDCWMVERGFDTWAMPRNVWVEWFSVNSTAVDRAQLDDLENDVALGYNEGRQMYLDAKADFDISGVEADNAQAYEELGSLFDIAEPTEADLARRDSLMRIIVGDDLMDEARRQYSFDYTEIDAALARNRENPDEEEVMQLTERLLTITNSLLGEEESLQGEIDVLKKELAELEGGKSGLDGMAKQMYDNTVDGLSLFYAGYDDDFEVPTGDMDFVVPGDSVDRYYVQKTLVTVDTAQLKRDGYLEYDTSDGYKLYVLQEGGHYCLIDTKTMIMREMEIKPGTGAAPARMNGKIIHDHGIGTPKAFISKQCIETFVLLPAQFEKLGVTMQQCHGLWEKFRNLLSQANETRQKLEKALECMYNEGMASLQSEISERFGEASKKEAEEMKKAHQNSVEKYKEALAKREARLAELQKNYPRLKDSEKILEECLRTSQNPGMTARLQADLNSVRQAIAKVDRVAEETKGFAKSCNFIIKQFQKEIKDIDLLLKTVMKNHAAIQKLFEKIPKSIAAIKAAGRTAIQGSGVLANVFGTVIGAFFQIAPLVILIQDNFQDIDDWVKLVDEVKSYDPCEGDETKWQNLYSEAKWDGTYHGAIDIAQIGADATSLVIDVFDLPLTPHWVVSLVIDLASITTAFVHPSISNNDKQKIRNGIAGLDCDKKPDEIVHIDDTDPPTTLLGAGRRGGYNGIGSLRRSVKRMQSMQSKPNRDPSGYVYEGVSSNRLEGVTATCYYKEEVEDMYGDLYERAVVWDAENYEQVNPQTTDVEGKYGWDVPRGLWQVKFEKQGYETAYSEWLPVPPPQLDVNVGMTQLRQPEVAHVDAYKNAVEVEFDKYMNPQTLNRTNIHVTKGGQSIDGTIQLINAEAGYQKPDVAYASRLAFMPTEPLQFNEKIVLTVSRLVESYAGLQMEADFQQEFSVVNDTLPIERDTTQVDSTMMQVAAPTASRISGTTVSRGTTVELSCKTEGATIWYTTDGTCPCDENGTRIRYTVPIAIDNHLVLKAYAVKGVMQESEVVSFEYFVEAEVVTAAIPVSAAGWCTFYDSQNNYQLPEGVKAYSVTVDNNQPGGLSYVSLPGNTIPKGTAVAIKAEGQTLTLTSVADAQPYVGENLLHGSDVATTTTANGSCYFYKACYGPAGTSLADWFGWYPANKDKGPFRSEAHRAWLAIPKAAATRSYYGFGDMTGIDAEAVEGGDDDWHDLQGRRLTEPQRKGVYIRRHQKVVR